MDIEEIREMVKKQPMNMVVCNNETQPKTEKIKKPFKDKINDFYINFGLFFGFVVYLFTFGVIFGFITYTVIGFKKMIDKIGNSTRKSVIISGSCETPEQNLIKGGSSDNEHS